MQSLVNCTRGARRQRGIEFLVFCGSLCALGPGMTLAAYRQWEARHGLAASRERAFLIFWSTYLPPIHYQFTCNNFVAN